MPAARSLLQTFFHEEVVRILSEVLETALEKVLEWKKKREEKEREAIAKKKRSPQKAEPPSSVCSPSLPSLSTSPSSAEVDGVAETAVAAASLLSDLSNFNGILKVNIAFYISLIIR